MRLPRKFGRYVLAEKIASGGMAEVYKAFLECDGGVTKTVAIKRLLPAWDESPEIERMLIDEARALMHLQHQSIAQVHELGRHEGIPFLAMEYVDGVDCAKLLMRVTRSNGRLPIELALYIIEQVLVALDFVHRSIDASGRSLEIVHRDVSPSNILISWHGEVKVADFGIAKGLHRTHRTEAGNIRGKYAYMAPEQACGQRVDARADIFSCGAVLFELIMSQRLFDAENDLKTIEMVKAAQLPTDAIGELAPGLQAILHLALAKEPSHRYQSAAEMLGDIQMHSRSSGQMAAGRELADYLCAKLKPKRRIVKSPRASIPKDAPKTRPLGDPAMHSQKKFNSSHAVRSSFMVAAIMAAAFAPHMRVVAAPAVAAAPAPAACSQNSPLLCKEGQGEVDPATYPTYPPLTKGRDVSSILQTSPGKIRGSVALDSEPVHAKGKLIIGEKSWNIETPFTLDGIEIGDGADASVSLSADGYRKIQEPFRLDAARSAYVKRFAMEREALATLSISAKPWGMAYLPGLATGRETPIASIKLKAGTYPIKVAYPPQKKVALAEVKLAEGDSKRCTVNFLKGTSIVCR